MAVDRVVRSTAARVLMVALVSGTVAASTTVFAGTADAAPGGSSVGSSARGFGDLVVNSVAQSPDKPVGFVTAPPNDSASLAGDQTNIFFGPDLIARATSISSTAQFNGGGDAKASANQVVMFTAAGDLTFNDASSSVSCPVNGPNVGSATGPDPAQTRVAGALTPPNAAGQIVVPATGGQTGTVTIMIVTPPEAVSATSASATGAKVTIDEEITAPQASKRVVSLTIATSSCASLPVPTITALSPDHGPGSQQTQVTVTGSGFVPGQTSVSVGGFGANGVNVTSDTSLTFFTPNNGPGPQQVTVTTPAGPSNSLTFTYSPRLDTSGVLRDAASGAPLNRGCVVLRSTSTGNYFLSGTGDFGRFDISTDDPGPFALAFFTTADGDCNSTAQTSPVPSWYPNIVLTGDPRKETIPAGVTAVKAGTTDIIACLGEKAVPKVCTAPTGTISGQVTGQLVPGPTIPINQACIVVLGGGIAGNLVGFAVSGADGTWTAKNLPVGIQMVVGVFPPFSSGNGPCMFDDGPPISPPGSLQPVFFRNVFLDLANPDLQNDPFGYAVRHGATTVANGTRGIDVCLTNTAASRVPRPSCSEPAAPTTTVTTATTVTATGRTLTRTLVSTSTVVRIAPGQAPPNSGSGPVLANTGFGAAAAVVDGAGVLLLGVGLLTIGRHRRRSSPAYRHRGHLQ